MIDILMFLIMPHTASAFAKYASEKYQQKYPNNINPKPIARLVKWNETDTVLEYLDGSTSYISTKFIGKNLSYIKRTKDKKMDTFVLTKGEKLQKLRNKKLLRILESESDE